MENNIRKIRRERGLTQGQLAKAAGTSQQQIQRLETGVPSIKFDMAVKICEVLGQPLAKLFPQTKSIIQTGKKSKSGRLTEDELSARLGEVGIETDPIDSSITFHLPGRIKKTYTISAQDRKRFERVISVADTSEARMFFCFDSEDYEIAVNLKYIRFFQVSFCPSTPLQTQSNDDPDPMERAPDVRVWVKGDREPQLFDVDSDEIGPDENDPMGQFHSLMFELDAMPSPEQFISFTDMGGTVTYIPIGQLVLLEVPLWVSTPSLIDDLYEQDSDDKAKPKVSRSKGTKK